MESSNLEKHGFIDFSKLLRHTILLTRNAVMTIDINDISAKGDDFDTEFTILLQSLNVQSSDALTLDEYLNISEEEEPHEFFTDEQLIESAHTIEGDKEQEAAVKRSELALTFSKQETHIRPGSLWY